MDYERPLLFRVTQHADAAERDVVRGERQPGLCGPSYRADRELVADRVGTGAPRAETAARRLTEATASATRARGPTGTPVRVE